MLEKCYCSNIAHTLDHMIDKFKALEAENSDLKNRLALLESRCDVNDALNDVTSPHKQRYNETAGT